MLFVLFSSCKLPRFFYYPSAQFIIIVADFIIFSLRGFEALLT